ncbi:right-handed parallel beta-helix repeat-containing protein [Pseudoxanthomonas sp. PXM02]|uniref:right-handed parallel beta-helix repeat-containing protein n=1 Tax=Pseudoxanthomonas sp. PXM02 TaxID=2769294 RepID=UPI0017875FF8|nr:right-handed parallel beta-helix repeat-containing protein [Pseudoxanthomonas sp. PXM02]MBD9478925.1 right-handed parallel beta-helix repeat-containing protein [Pseudoxanthomonas sp. PXM02]
MRLSRRKLMGAGAGLAFASFFPQGRAAILDARDFGARGDGRHDDTRALQAAIDALPAGGTLALGAGNYVIDPERSLRLRSRTRLSMARETRLVARANAAPRAYVLLIEGVHDVEVSGGRIVGDRDHHLSTAGEWGHGIMVRGAESVLLRDLHITRCWGDGISVGGISGARVTPSRDIRIEDVTCTGNRRQGLTIGRSRHVRVLRSHFIATRGTLPGCGIDIEPDPGDSAEDIAIEACTLRGNHGAGLQVYARGRRITVRRCDIRGNRGDGVLIREGEQCVIEDNDIVGNGLRGIAVRGGRGITVVDNRFADNATGLRRQRSQDIKGWMHVDVAKTAQDVRVDRSNRFE